MLWLTISLSVLILAATQVISSPPASATGGQGAQPTPVSPSSSLAYLSTDVHGRSGTVIQKPRSDLEALPAKVDHSAPLATMPIPLGCEVSGLHAASRGQWIAMQVNCEAGGFVQMIHAASGQVRRVGNELGPDSLFLGWSPTGNEMILKADVVSNPRVYLVNVASGQATEVPVPATTYDVALSRDGKRMLYSLTHGLGHGSETWMADLDGRNARRVLAEPRHLIVFARWSPSGDKITYIRMPDSNIPFTTGELWVMTGRGNDPVSLGQADAGHGYELAWSPDGQHIAFVGRENPNDRAADWRAERLVSNIYIANVSDQTISAVTGFQRTLAESPAWSPDSRFLAFSAASGSGRNIWVFDVQGRQLHQVTQGANARHPVWLPGR